VFDITSKATFREKEIKETMEAYTVSVLEIC